MFDLLANIFGWVMNVLCLGLKGIGIVSVPVGIVLFGFVMSLLMLPLTIGQIKFSLAKVKMAPKMQVIYDHYAAIKEPTGEEVRKQSEEIKAVYKEAGVTPHGKVLGIILQVILLMAMYQVAGNVTKFVPMFQEAPETAFLFLGRNVSDVPLDVLKTGFDGVSLALILFIFLVFFPFGAIKEKNVQGLVRGCMLAALWAAIASKLPVGLCLYWGSKTLIGIILGKIIFNVLKKKEKEMS